MNNPELYGKCNHLPLRDAEEFLEAYSSKIKWRKDGDRSLDIGSADGDVTINILGKYLPKNYSKLIGCDISKEMISYTNKKYKDDRTYFIEHDIRKNVPSDMIGAFDHVFSFYTLHWIQDQRDIMTKIYTMLEKGGDCLLLIVASSHIPYIYRLLAKQPKWTSWINDVKEFASPYHDSLEPEKDLRHIMENVGFKNVDVTCQHRSYLYEDVNLIKETMASICPFKIPKEFMKDYLEDYVETGVRNQVMKEVTDKNGKFMGLNSVYSLLWAYGSKE